MARSVEPIFTIGHSTRTLERFCELLIEYGIVQLIDVRTIPRSRHNPQFNSAELARTLRALKIRYLHLPALGGLRHPKKGSINTGWENESFRGFADYMQTTAFEDALEKLITLAKRPTAIMCAESVPWRCHRSLIADALRMRKIPVVHIMSRTSSRAHELTPFAKVKGKKITYP